MTHMRNIDSVPDPRKKPTKQQSVDPERFEKALKVEKNDATDKREKRNRPKKAEEAEDEIDDIGAAIPVPKGLFKEYMKEDEKGDSVLDVEGGKTAHLVSDEASSPAPAPEEGYIAEDDGSTSNISVGVSENAPPPPPAPEESSDDYDTTPPEETPPPPAPSADQSSQTFQPPQSSFTPDPPQTLESDEPKQTEKTSEPQKTSSDKKKTTDTKKKKKKKKPTEVKKKKTTKTAPKKDVKAQTPKAPTKGSDEIKAPKEEVETKEEPKESTGPKQATKGKVAEKETTPTPKDSKDVALPQVEGLDDKQDTKDKDHDSQKGSDEATVGQTAPAASSSGIEQLQLSPFANMPKDVFELFEKMVGLMTMQKDDGKTTVTVTLNMKGSPFNECQVVLEHYDTAPHAFNVQFLGNPEGVEKFAKNMQGLTSAIAESKLTFSINLLPPKLSKNYAGRIEATDNDADSDEKKDGEEKQE